MTLSSQELCQFPKIRNKSRYQDDKNKSIFLGSFMNEIKKLTLNILS